MHESQPPATTYYLRLRWFLIVCATLMLAQWVGFLVLIAVSGGFGLRIALPVLIVVPIVALVLLAEGLTYRVVMTPDGITVQYFWYRFAASWAELEGVEIGSPTLRWLVLRTLQPNLVKVFFWPPPAHLRGRAIPLIQAWRKPAELEAQLGAYAPQLLTVAGERTGFDPALGLAVPAAAPRRRVSRLMLGLALGVGLLNILWSWGISRWFGF